MDIYKLRDNLINTIEGKVEFQSELGNRYRNEVNSITRASYYALIQYLENNITELTSILKDVNAIIDNIEYDEYANY